MPALPPPRMPIATLVRPSVPQAPRVAHELTKPKATLRLDAQHLASALSSYKTPDVANLLAAQTIITSGLTFDSPGSFG